MDKKVMLPNDNNIDITLFINQLEEESEIKKLYDNMKDWPVWQKEYVALWCKEEKSN